MSKSEDVLHQARGKKRATVDEIMEHLDDLKVCFELKLLRSEVVDGKIVLRQVPRGEMSFKRRLIADLNPDPDRIEDDLITNPAIYARYSEILSKLDSMVSEAKAELTRTMGRVKLNIRETWSNPNVPLKDLTVDLLDSIAMCDDSVIVLQEIVREAEEARASVNSACAAMKMKHEACLRISITRRSEAFLTATSPSTTSGQSWSGREDRGTRE